MKLIKFLSPAVIVLMVFLSSCAKNDDYVEVTGDAKIKIVNAVQGSSPQDFYQNDTKLSTSVIAYGQSSDYFKIIGGTASTLTVKIQNSQTVSASTFAAAQVGASYTAFYYANQSGSGVINGFENDTAVPATGKAKVRFLNLGIVFLNALNVTTTAGATITTGLAYGGLSVYNTIDANTGLNVNLIGSTDLKSIPGTEFQSGKNYTVWFDAANATTVNYHVVAEN